MRDLSTGYYMVFWQVHLSTYALLPGIRYPRLSGHRSSHFSPVPGSIESQWALALLIFISFLRARLLIYYLK